MYKDEKHAIDNLSNSTHFMGMLGGYSGNVRIHATTQEGTFVWKFTYMQGPFFMRGKCFGG